MRTTLLNYIRKIAKCTFDHNPEKLYLDHFDTLNNPDSDVTTNGIRIRAKAFYNPWDIRMGTTTLFFPYQIRISDAGVSGAYKLVSRKWIIRDGNKEECVNGEGVIGMYPVISPGCEDFVYESVSMIKSLQGDMEGSFLFKSEGGDQGIIEAKIGRFKFEIGEDSKLIKVNFLNKKIEVLS